MHSTFIMTAPSHKVKSTSVTKQQVVALHFHFIMKLIIFWLVSAHNDLPGCGFLPVQGLLILSDHFLLFSVRLTYHLLLPWAKI